MLKGIPNIISPELLKVLDEMGHGDSIVIGDLNYPACSHSKGNVLVRQDGVGTRELLDAILSLFPLDAYNYHPMALMAVEQPKAGEKVPEPPIWADYKAIVKKYESRGEDVIEFIERDEFYKRAKQAYAIVTTTEDALFACMILTKGTNC